MLEHYQVLLQWLHVANDHYRFAVCLQGLVTLLYSAALLLCAQVAAVLLSTLWGVLWGEVLAVHSPSRLPHPRLPGPQGVRDTSAHTKRSASLP